MIFGSGPCKILKRIIDAVIIATVLSLTACGKDLDLEQAALELDEYCANHPVCFRLPSDEYPEQNIVYDITGDGYEDLTTGILFGSGIVREYIVVYDVRNQEFYTLGDIRNSYSIREFDDGCLMAEEYVYPDRYTNGTVEFTDGELVFIPESE